MKKYLSILLFIALMASPAFAGQSYFYSFSSGDVLDPEATVTYGIGRLDFEEETLKPTILMSGDTNAITVGSFPRNGTQYLYTSKVNKKDKSTTKSTTSYTVYNPHRPLNEQVDTAKPHDVVVNISKGISIDIALPPDDMTGIIYVIDSNTTLMAYDPLTWQVTQQPLPTGYDVHKLVSLAPYSYNYLYVWSSKMTNVSADGSYTPVSSDVHVYDRTTLEKLATFSNVRTGFDTTLQKSDDEQSMEMGRGLVYIDEKFIAFVAYESSDVNSAHIVKIDENYIETSGDKAASVLITSTDIGGRNIDIESPMPDLKGGLYFEAYSRDANPNDITTRESYIYHWTTDKLVSLDIVNGKANAELVISGGKYKGSVMVYQPTSVTTNEAINTYLWDGNTSAVTYQIDKGTIVGVEIEKPFTDSADGLYFMAEKKVEPQAKTAAAEGTQEQQQEVGEYDGLWWWKGPNVAVKTVWTSASELEIENPELDANKGFYFVDVSTDLDVTNKIGTTVMTLHYCREGVEQEIYELGTFNVPPSTFKQSPSDPYATPEEILQDEFIIRSDYEYDLLLAGAGSIGGDYKLTIFGFAERDSKILNETDIRLPILDQEDFGGYADLAGALKFTDASPSIGSSGGGCNVGLGLLSFSLLALFAVKFKKK